MEDVISLGIGEPDFATPEPFVEAGIKALQRGETHYTSNSGLMELRRAIAAHLDRLYGQTYNPESEILISVGVSEALYLACTALLNPGDEVLIPEPCFVSYAPEVSFAGGEPIMIPTYAEDQWQVTAEIIQSAVTERTKAVLLGYPNNPTGAVMSRERLNAIAAVVKQHDLVVISDELYDQLVYGVEHVCFPSLPGMYERTLLLMGFSKAYAMTGWRVGYAAGPAELMDMLRRVHQYTIMCAPTVSQYAALAALEHGEPYVEEMHEAYDRRRRLIVDGLNEIGLHCVEPKGAFYAFPSIAASGMEDGEFAERLLQEEQVAVVPGSAFGQAGKGYVRCSYATAYEEIEQALERMHRFVKRHG
jgi:aminotransferase